MSRKNVGFEFYSEYLGSNCAVVFYLTDRHWWFKAHKYSGRVMKAGTRLSYFK